MERLSERSFFLMKVNSQINQHHVSLVSFLNMSVSRSTVGVLCSLVSGFSVILCFLWLREDNKYLLSPIIKYQIDNSHLLNQCTNIFILWIPLYTIYSYKLALILNWVNLSYISFWVVDTCCSWMYVNTYKGSLLPIEGT